MLRKVLCGAGVLAASMAIANPAQAAFMVTITSGGSTLTIDGTNAQSGTGSCLVANGTSGLITVNGCTVGNFTISGELATNNVPGNAALGRLASSLVVTGNGAGGTLRVLVSSTGYLNPGSIGDSMGLSSSFSGTAVDSGPTTAMFQSYANSGGVLNGTGNPTTPQSCAGLTSALFTTQCMAASTATTTFARSAADYSLTNLITLTLGGQLGNQVQLTGITAATVPEPGSMMLLGTGLFGLAGLARRRFNLGART